MIKGFRQIASLTALSRVFGLVRDICYGHFFGADKLLDAWIIAFRIPNLSRRLFGEGAASASFIPVYSEELHTNRENAAVLANTAVTVLFIILAAVVLVAEAGILTYRAFFTHTEETHLILSLSSIMLPYMLFVCIVAMLAGILNVHRHFAAPAAAPVVLNICIIGTILLSAWALKLTATQQLFCVAVAVLIAGLLQLTMQIPPLRRNGISLRPAWAVHSQAFKRILFLMGPMIIGLTVTQINTLADDLIAWWFSSSQEKGEFFMFLGRQIQYPMSRGSVSHLYYAQRIYQLPLGILGISLATAIFPVMSADAARKDYDALRKTISHGIRSIIFVAIPATVGLIMVSRPLIRAAFQHGKFTPADTSMVVRTLIFYSIGLTGYFAQQVLARAFYAIQDSKTPMRSAFLAVVANFLLNLTLIWYLDRAGLACATAICSYVQVLILVLVLKSRFGSSILDNIWVTFTKTVITTAVMWLSGSVIIKLMESLPITRGFDVLRLLLVVLSSIAVYILVARLLKTKMLALLIKRSRS